MNKIRFKEGQYFLLHHIPPALTPLTPPHIPVTPAVFLEPLSQGSR